MSINFGSKKKKYSKSNNPAKRIESKILQLLPPDAVDDGVQVMVTEVSCTEPDCVPLETLVICIGFRARWADKILKPIAEVSDSDLEELALEIPSSWKEWIQTEEDRKGLKNTLADDNMPSNQSIVSVPPATTPSNTTTSTLITMRPRTDQLQPQKITQSVTSPAVMSTDKSLQPPLPPPNPSSTPTKNKTIDEQQPPVPIHVSMKSVESSSVNPPKVNKPPALKSRDQSLPTARHSSKGVRQRGCPCCDPDNMDNLLDKMLYFDAPP